MNAYEEELQGAAERGELKADSLDEKAYQEVFRALKKRPDYELPPDFADRVVRSIIARKKSRDSRDYLWFGAGIVFLLIAFVATVLYTGFKLDMGFLSEMADYKGLAIFGVVFIALLNYLDKRLVKDRRVESL